MKAMIMAGGKGTRLCPLTNHIPKPMIPLLDKPCLEYIIEWLKRYGIVDIGITTHYMSHVIKDYFGDGSKFGVNIEYFHETEPLGTAGSIKNAQEFLDETFIVASGDIVTDFNIHEIVDFHKRHRSICTLVVTEVDNPFEYGLVKIRNDKVVHFLEKPRSWLEVFSDTVNTGVYVLEPEIIKKHVPNKYFDFSKDLFPKLLIMHLPIYGYVEKGYWSDIGNISNYVKTQFDILEGLVDVEIHGKRLQEKIWVGKDVFIDDQAIIEGAVFIGGGTSIGAYAKVGPYTVIGKNNYVGKNATVEHSVLWSNNKVDSFANLKEVVVFDGMTEKVDCEVFS